MAQTIKLKRSAVAGGAPTVSQLELGEVAINTYDGKMYIKKSVAGTESIVEISGGDSGTGIIDEFLYTATAGQTAFSGNDDNSDFLSYVIGAIQVFLNGILLDPETDYTATNGALITLTSAASANDYIQIFSFKKKISDGNVTVDSFSGNNSTTAFTLSIDPGDENNTRVFVDGVYQSKANYTVSGTTLTFSTAPPSGTAIEVESGNRSVTIPTTENLDFPDNVKLRLGTSQDLEIYHDASDSLINDNGTGSLKLQTGGSTKLEVTSTGVDVTGNISVSGTVDGVDIAARDAVLTSTTTTAGAALPKAGGAMTGAITTNSTFDGRDVATDGAKLDGIEAGATADQTQSEINALGITATGLSGTPAISVANITTTGELRGPASLVIDPAGIGDNTGTVVIKGNLQVDGSQTTINSTTVTVDDLNLTLASGAANGTAANGAGITIDGASATLTYNSTGDNWAFNKNLDVTGNIAVSGTVDGVDLQTLNTTANAALPLAGGTMTGNLTINKEDPNINLSDTSSSRTLAMFVDNNNSVVRASGPLLLQVGSQSAITIDASRNTTFAGTISSGAISATGSANSGSASHLPALLASGSYGGGIATRDTQESGWYQQTNGADWHFYHNRTVASDTPASKIVLSFNSSGNATFAGTINTAAYGSVLATTQFDQNVMKSSVANQQGAFVRMAVSSQGNPTYAFEDDTNTGMFTSGADTLNFTTGGTERMRITSAGNVGIGNSAPTSYSGYKILHIGNATTGNTGLLKFGTGSTADGPELYASGTSLRLNTSGSVNVLNLVGSNVGIGTTSPNYQLDIENSGNAVARLHAGASSSASLRLINDAQDWDVNLQTNDKFAIYDHTAGTQPFTIMPTTNNVGIGTSSPNTTLELGPVSALVGPTLRLSGGTGGSNGIAEYPFGTVEFFSNDPSGDGAEVKASVSGLAHTGSTAPGGEIALSTTNSGASSTLTERFRLTHNGFVGIGTSSPTHGLTVSDLNGGDNADMRRITIKSETHGVNSGFRFDSESANGTARAGGYYFVPGDTDANTYLGLSATDTSYQMVVTREGRVGIGGVTSPAAALDVSGKFNVQSGQVWSETTQGGGTGSIHIDPDSGTNHAGGAITFGASDHSNGTVADAGIYVRSDGTYGTKMYLSTTDSYAQGSKTAMMIDNTGNVGIGTIAPNAPLTVWTASSATSQSALRLNNPGGFNSANAGCEIIFSQDRSTSEDYRMAAISSSQQYSGSSSGGEMKFWTRNSGSITEKVRLHANGVLAASAGIALGSGLANTAANTLNDYEEGTWTPDLRNGTTSLSTQTWLYGPTATYTKVGDLVYIHLAGKLSSVAGTGSGELRIFGLPFMPQSTGGYQEYRINFILGNSVYASDSGDAFAFVRNGGTDLGTRVLNGGDTVFTTNRLDSDTFFSCYGCYKT